MGSLESKERKLLVNTGLKAQFAPPKHLLYMRENTLMAHELDLSRLELVGDPFPVLEQVGTNTGNSAAGFSVSDTGALAYRSGGGGTTSYLLRFDRNGKEIDKPLPSSTYQSPALSPDLRRVAVSEGVPPDLWLRDLIRSTSTRFTFDMGSDFAPTWSPDGNQIVFATTRDGPSNLYQKNSNGISPEEPLLKSESAKTPEHWSADGDYLLYRDQDPKTGVDLWALSMKGEKKPQPVVRSTFTDFQGRFSNDGRWIAYASNESGAFQVYVVGFPSAAAKFQISTNGGYLPRWRRDGKELFFVSGDRDIMAVDISVEGDGSLKPGIPRKLFGANPINLTGHRNSWDVSPDGQLFLINSLLQTQGSVFPVGIILNWQRGRNAAQ